jgi:glycosyltransferase involved in cell wall biosynthesis
VPKILFADLHRANRSGSQRFRYEQYIPYLTQNGFECHHSFLINEADDKAFYAAGHYAHKAWILAKSILIRLQDWWRIQDYDIVFVQREALMLGTAFFEKMYAKNVPLVFDFDDAIWLDVISEGNKKFSFLKNAAKTNEIIAVAKMIFAGNDYLAQYAKQFNDNVKIIPTTVDTDKFLPKTTVNEANGKKGVVEIGWTGSFSTIEHLRFRIEALYRIKEKYKDKVVFKVIGDKNFRDTQLQVQGLAWQAATEVQDLSTIDIGIMPLPDNQWTRGKCGFKGLTYMSLAIPAVMSPVGVNTSIIQEAQNGYLADTTEEWVEKLSLLIENPDLRQQIGQAGRQTVQNHYSITSQKDNYLLHFQSLLSN